MIVVAISEKQAGRFDARVAGRLVAAGTPTPFLDAARALLAEGVDPRTTIVMRHVGSEHNILRSSIGSIVQA
jgi:hypothetical protein